MKKIYLIDWNNFIYRMFYWLPEFSTKDGKIVNAIFGMAKFFVNQLVREKPDYVFFIKDAKWKNFRHDLYDEYKSTRDRMPDNLRCQIGDIEKMIKMMWIDIIEINWYEADDVIWTLATTFWKDQNNDIYILSWDKDLYSLISNNVKIYDTMKRKVFDIEETIEKFWIKPEMIIDYLAIVWDKSDNIPWIDWFWPQKAVSLINKIWWVDEIYIEAEKVEKWEKDFMM
jgi:DNA polymerase-1